MGGTRFIGVYLTKILVKQGHEVVLFNRGKKPAPVEGIKQIHGDRTDANQIQEKLPPNNYYRANRQTIIQRKYIKEIDNFFNGKLKVNLTINHEEIIISKDNCKDFKDWLQK